MKKKEPEQSTNFIIPIFVGIFNVLIILFPAEMISASKEGLGLWFNNVLPSLLPFVIGTNILCGLGATNFIGTLLEPLMKPLFGVPGVGGFALVTGMTSGYPMGAKVVAQLRADESVTQAEAQRMMSFCNNSGPLFVLGTVGVGMLKSAAAGYFILAVHFVSAIVTGIIFKRYKADEPQSHSPAGRLLPRAIKAMGAARHKDRRGFGQILGDSVKSAMETMTLIGGFIILFCVLVKVLEIVGAIGLTQIIFADALTYFGISPEMYKGLVVGLIEVTNGAKSLSAEGISKNQLVILCGIISFGGFCIHAQAINFSSKTDIKASVYLLSKGIQALIAIAAAELAFPYFNAYFTTHQDPYGEVVPAFLQQSHFFERLIMSMAWFLLSALVIAVLILVCNATGLLRIRKRRRRYKL